MSLKCALAGTFGALSALSNARSVRIMPRILIVEDDTLMIEMLSTVLSSAGFDIEHVGDRREAMQHLATDDFDLMITDLVMPDSEWLALISAVKALHPSLRIIAISGAWQGEFLRSAELMWADRAVRKPLTPDVLLEAVSGVLGMD